MAVVLRFVFLLLFVALMVMGQGSPEDNTNKLKDKKKPKPRNVKRGSHRRRPQSLNSPIFMSDSFQDAIYDSAVQSDEDDEDDDEDQKDTHESDDATLETIQPASLDELLAAYKLGLVLFTKEDCTSCPKFENVLAQTAKSVPNDKVVLRKIDCTNLQQFCRRHTPKVPSIQVYEFGKPRGSFNSSMTSEKALQYIHKRLKPTPDIFTQVGKKPYSWKAAKSALVVAVPTKDHPLLLELQSLLEDIRDIGPAFVVIGEEMATDLGINGALPKIVVWNKEEKQFFVFKGSHTYSELSAFFYGHTFPVLEELSASIAFKYHSTGMPIFALLTVDRATFANEAADDVISVLHEYRGKVLSLNFNLRHNPMLLKYYQVGSYPTAVIETPTGQLYRMEDVTIDSFGPESVRVFIDAFLDGLVKPHRRYDQNAPPDLVNGVRIATSRTFDDIVRKPFKNYDTLIMFFTNSNTICEQYAGIFAAVALSLKNSPGIVVLAFNIEENELPQGYQVKAVPSLAWVPQFSIIPEWITPPDSPTHLPNYEQLLEFVKQHATVPVSITSNDGSLAQEQTDPKQEQAKTKHSTNQNEKPPSPVRDEL